MATTHSNRTFLVMGVFGVFIVIFSFCAGIAGSLVANRFLNNSTFINSGGIAVNGQPASDIDSATVAVADKASPSVVSIVISKNVSQLQQELSDPFSSRFYQYFYGTPQTTTPDSGSNSSDPTKLQEVGAGSGFIISADGLILTNRHVVEDTAATYTVILNDGTKLPATVVARDTVLDIAVVKVTTDIKLTALTLGDSDTLKIGQTAIAIGNSLGEFSNTVSSGIISGLGRSITASDGTGSGSEQLSDVIQTDASINPGNSGGPLLDIDGRVIGVDVAIAQNAQNIGFAIPINSVKTIIESVSTSGRIIRPYLGVRYVPVDADVAKQKSLSVDYGALVSAGTGAEAGVVTGSPAEKAGIKAGDVIIAINGQKLDATHDLQTEIQKFKVGDKITVKVQRGTQAMDISITLEERPAS